MQTILWIHNLRNLLQVENVPQYHAGMVLEVGSISVDGKGTLFTTEECLLYPSRNRSMSKDDIENRLEEFLGINKSFDCLMESMVMMTPMDMLIICVRLLNLELLYCIEQIIQGTLYKFLHEADEGLQRTMDAKERKIKVLKLHLPGILVERFLLDGCKLG